MKSEGSNNFLQNKTGHENAPAALTSDQNEGGRDLASEKYKNLSIGDIWKRVDAKGEFVEALRIGSIYYFGEKMAAVSNLGPDLRVPEDSKSLDTLLAENGTEWKLEDLRRELATHKYVLERAGTVSETAIVEDEVGKSPFVHLEKPGDKAYYIRTKKTWLDSPGTVIVTVTRVKDGYRVFDPETDGKDGRFYSIPAIDSLALTEGWVSDDFPDTVPNSHENIPDLPKFFKEPEKKEVRHTWKKEELLNTISPDEVFMLRSDNGGAIRYVRRGDDFFDVQSNTNDTKGILRRLNNGWQLVEHPENGFMAGGETRQFLSGETPEDETQHTVVKKSDGYYVRKDKVWTPQLVRDENVFAGFRNAKLQDEDDWQGPLTRVQMLERMRAEHWEPVVEINSLEDFLKNGGEKAVKAVQMHKRAFIDTWDKFQNKFSAIQDTLSLEQRASLSELWKEKIVPSIIHMMSEDFQEQHGLNVVQSETIASELMDRLLSELKNEKKN